MAPPKNAMVLCVDEKASIQALQRAQGYLKLPNGRALTGQSHDYKRHGTTTLFAAWKRQQARSRLSTRSALDTHEPKNDRWPKRPPNVHFHFTPTRASWLNQVEIWFPILQVQSLKGFSCTTVTALCEHIDAFISRYNETAEPFALTKSEVHQKRVKGRRLSDLVESTTGVVAIHLARVGFG
jgi:transposase